MRVLLILPCVGMEPFSYSGIAQLSGVLKRSRHARRLVYLNDREGFEADPATALAAVKDFEPDLAYVVVFPSQLELAARVCTLLKKQVNCPVVCGGPHAFAAPETLAAGGVWDYVCVGEAETAVAELLRRLKNLKDTRTVPGLWAVGPDRVIRNEPGPLADAGDLPARDYAIFPYQQIVDARDGRVSITTRQDGLLRYGDRAHRTVADEIREKRGPTPTEYLFVRRRPVKDVIAEIAHLLKTYKNIRMFVLEDDVFTDDKNYVIRFSEEYRQVTELPFVCNAGAKGFDTEIARCLKWAGCRLLRFNVRSGSEGIRRMVLKRLVTNPEIVDALDLCRKENLATSVQVAFGFPGEKRQDIVETVQFLGRAQPARLMWGAFFPFPGTALAEAAERSGGPKRQEVSVPVDATSAPVLDFGAEQNLFLDKVYSLLPWYVNACSQGPCAKLYDPMIRWVDELPSEVWQRVKPRAFKAEEALSAMLNDGHLVHYCFRAGERVAVRSDAL